MSDLPLVSVVVNTLNRIATLPTTLQGLQHLRYPHIEVVVVNGPSVDGTDVYLDLFWRNRIKIRSCPTANLSVSRNIGIRAAAGDIICFIDDDAIPEPDWVNLLVEAYRKSPKVGAVGGWVRDTGGIGFQTKFIVSKRDGRSIIDLEKLPDASDEGWGEKFITGLIGVNSSFRAAALREVGGFDENYAYFLDETDVLVRLFDKGYSIRSLRSAEVHHKFAPSELRPDSVARRRYRETATSGAYFIIAHGPERTSSMPEKLEAVGAWSRELRESVVHFCNHHGVSGAHRDRMLEEVDDGVAAGVAAGFQPPKFNADDGPDSPFLSLKCGQAGRRALRVALVSDVIWPVAVGGVGVIFSETATELASRGHEVTLISRAPEGANSSVDFEDGVWVHRLAPDAPLAEVTDLPAMPETQSRFARQVLFELDRVDARRSFDLVLGTIWDVEIAAAMASRRYRVGVYLVTSYLLALDSKPEWRRKGFYERHFLPMVAAEKWCLDRADRVFTSTQAVLEDVERLYEVSVDRKRVSLVPFGLPEPPLGSAPTRPNKDVTILFVGRQERRKGIDLLLAAAPSILRKHENARIRIVGAEIPNENGESYQKGFLRDYNGEPWLERVEFSGYVDSERLALEFAGCDVFVAPSRYESFGLIYVEAMRAGKPCVGIRVGGAKEVIEHGVTGYVTHPEEASLTGAIDLLVSDPDLMKRMGRAARDRYERLFSLDRYVDRLESDFYGWVEKSSPSTSADWPQFASVK